LVITFGTETLALGIERYRHQPAMRIEEKTEISFSREPAGLSSNCLQIAD
jgi:hypothetical protein